MSSDFETLEQRLGYDFRDRELLRAAMTHPSYAIEKNLDYDNQRLEFLGDAVLDLLLAEELFRRYPEADEGVLTKTRSALVCQDALVRITEALGIGDFLLLGKGERIDGNGARKSVQADGFEALTGAIYLDGGLDALRSVILSLYAKIYPDPMRIAADINPKGALQEYSQSKWGEAPVYKVCGVSGPEHCPEYTVEVRLRNYVANGTGGSRKLAESECARRLLSYLENSEREKGK